MKEWKIKQEIFHRLNPKTKDDLSINQYKFIDYQSKDELIAQIIEYFKISQPIILYPAKSFLVGIVYSTLLVEFFNEDFYAVLNDPELLYNNDPYFKPYKQEQEIYDKVLECIGLEFDRTLGEIPDIINYFNEEFLIGNDEYVPKAIASRYEI